MPGIETMDESSAQRIYTMEQYRSSESLEDRHSNASSTESKSHLESMHRKVSLDNYGSTFFPPSNQDHEFIPTRMKTITASKPAANPGQFTRIPSNPLLLSAQTQMMKVEQVKKTKEIVRKTEDEPDWQSNLNVWKDRRRKQSEDALLRVAEIKKVDDDSSHDSGLEQRKLSLGKKLSGLVHNDDDDDWLGPPISRSGSRLENTSSKTNNNNNLRSNSVSSIPANSSPTKTAEEPVPSSVSKRKISPKRSRSAGVLISLEEIKQTTEQAQQQSQPLRRKSSELSTTMKSRLEAFESVPEENASFSQKAVPTPDETFRQKLESFKEKEIEKEEAKYAPPKKSITDFLNPPEITNSVVNGHENSQVPSQEEGEIEDEDDVDKLLDDALEESYRSVLEEESDNTRQAKSLFTSADFSPSSGPPKEKPPPPPPPPVTEPPQSSPPPPPPAIHQKKPSQASSPGNRQEWLNEMCDEQMDKQQHHHRQVEEEEMDRQEREIIASLELEEKEHLKYMESVSSMKSMSVSGPAPPVSSKNSGSTQKPVHHKQSSPPNTKFQPEEAVKSPKKKSQAHEKNVNQHWLIQEAEQRRISDIQHRSPPQTKTSQINYQSNIVPTYENSADIRNNKANLHQQQPNINNNNNHFSIQSQQPPQPIYNNYPTSNSSYNYENTYANLQQHQHPSPPQQNNYPTSRFESNFESRSDWDNNNSRVPGPQVPPRNMENPDRMLSVSGKKKCSHCREELGRGAAMIIESLRLYYHLRCFQCCVCQIQLGNGTAGTDVRVRNNKLHCQNCYSNDDGLKFSKV